MSGPKALPSVPDASTVSPRTRRQESSRRIQRPRKATEEEASGSEAPNADQNGSAGRELPEKQEPTTACADNRQDVDRSKRNRAKSPKKIDANIQGTVRSMKLSDKLLNDLTPLHILNSSARSLDGASMFRKLAQSRQSAHASTAALTSKLHASASSLDAQLGSDSRELKAGKADSGQLGITAEAQKKQSLMLHNQSSCSLSEPPVGSYRHRRANSLKEMKGKDRPCSSREDKERDRSCQSTQDLSRTSSSTLEASPGISPKTRVSRIISAKQLELGPDGQVIAVIRSPDGERKRTIVIRRKTEPQTRALDHSAHRKPSSRQRRQASLRQKQESARQSQDSHRASDHSSERYVPLRAPSGDASALALPTKVRAAVPSIRKHSIDDSTDGDKSSGRDAPEDSPRTDTSHTSLSTLSRDTRKSSRPKIRQRARAAENRQGRENIRQIYLKSMESLPLAGDSDSSDESSLSETENHPDPDAPAQFVVALDPLNNEESPTTTHLGLALAQGGVSRRLLSATKSPFRVAGKLLKKAVVSASGETEPSMPFGPPLEDSCDDINEATKKIAAIGITRDQIEMLKKAGLKITQT